MFTLRYLAIPSVLLILASAQVLATSSGITRRSTTNSAGCGGGGCHAGSSNVATTVTIAEAVNNVITVIPNERIVLTLEVAHASRVAVGMNISVRRTLNGNVSVGTLDANGDQGMRLMQGELTQSTPKTMADGKATFQFGFTSPAQTGEYYLHAVANAVNRNGSPDNSDQWNFLTPVKIVVSGIASVAEASYEAGALSIAPLPAHGSVSIVAETTPGEAVTVQIINAVGAIVRTERSTSQDERYLYVWDGRSEDGSPALPGTYSVAIIGQRRISYGRAVIVR